MKQRTKIFAMSSAMLLALAIVLVAASAALAQRSPLYSLGCWGIVSSGGGGERIGAQDRLHDAITSVGGQMQGASYRINANHFVLWTTLNPQSGPAIPPVVDVGMQYLPFIFGQVLDLDSMCR